LGLQSEAKADKKTGNYPITVTVNSMTAIFRIYVGRGVSRITTILKM